MIKIFVKLVILIISFQTILIADEKRTKIVFYFSEEELSKLKVRKVRGAENKTAYSIGQNDNGNYLKAIANNAASGLGREMKIDLNKLPFINITWKIEQDIPGINEKSKKGHDFAARVFVIKKTGATPLSNKAVNYVFQVMKILAKIGEAHIQKNRLTMFFRQL